MRRTGTPIIITAVAIGTLLAGCRSEPAATDGSKSANRSRSAADAAVPDGPYWPRFHGPNGDNISTDTGLLKQWPNEGPELIWAASGIGHGYSGVTLADGLIYTAGNIDGKTVVTALDLDGQPKWTAENGPAWDDSHAGTRGTPTYDDGYVYHESPSGQIECLDAKTGQKIWERNILDEFGGKNITWALAESVLIDGDHLVCCPGGSEASVAALDKRTGQTAWKTPGTGDRASYASPTLAECGGLWIILTMNAKALIGVNADGGQLLFEFPHETKYDVNALKPLYHAGHVFISSGYGSGSEMVRLHVDGQRIEAESAWKSKELDNHHGGVVLWEGYLYGAAHQANRANWICLDAKTGQMMYKAPGVGKGPLTCADGMLYTMSENRSVGLVRPTPAGHELISRFKIPPRGEGPTWAHPVVCGGRLYIRHGDFLYAYDVEAK